MLIWPLKDEQSRLLFDDPNANHYGSFGDQNASIIQADPQEVERETEALQKVVAQTSKYAILKRFQETAKLYYPSCMLQIEVHLLTYFPQPSGRYFCHGSPKHASNTIYSLSCPGRKTSTLSGCPREDVRQGRLIHHESAISREHP